LIVYRFGFKILLQVCWAKMYYLVQFLISAFRAFIYKKTNDVFAILRKFLSAKNWVCKSEMVTSAEGHG
jgi:hypothetical protein